MIDVNTAVRRVKVHQEFFLFLALYILFVHLKFWSQSEISDVGQL